MEVKKYIQDNEQRFLDELASLIRIPSISAKAEHKDDIIACANRWKELLLEAGVDRAEVMPSKATRLSMPRRLSMQQHQQFLSIRTMM